MLHEARGEARAPELSARRVSSIEGVWSAVR